MSGVLNVISSYKGAAAAPTNYPTGAAIAYGLRELPGYSWTGALIRVRRSSDNAEEDFYQGATAGSFNTTRGGGGTELSAWVGANNGFVKTWYDQSGNTNNLTQTTNSKQPQIVSSGTIITHNSKPVVNFIASSSCDMNLTSTITSNNPQSSIHVFKRSASGVNAYGLDGNNGSSEFTYTPVHFNDNKYYFRTNTNLLVSTSTDTTSSQMILTGVMSISNKYMRKNGSAISTSASTNSYTQNLTKYGSGGGGFNNDYSSEFLVWLSDQNSNIGTIETAANQYYGIF